MAARVIKSYEERKAEILGIAWALISERGYDNTSVNAIIKKADIAKGTFYHYFPSKEDIIDSVIEGMTAQIMANIEPIVKDNSLSAIEKLNGFIAESRSFKVGVMDQLMEASRVMYRPENIILREKMESRNLEIVTPVIEDIIVQGLKEGVFKIEHPTETAEMVLHLLTINAEQNAMTIINRADHDQCMCEIERRIEVIEQSLERVLCAPNGSIKLKDRDILDAISDYIKRTDTRSSLVDDS